ncbi:hypothetical protein D6833_04995 [Candidatus Parcubacteria bacterium]|nr:MAG: hypothetical protein D6833_04995 [Candidatus Parcubacteria bacterium]
MNIEMEVAKQSFAVIKRFFDMKREIASARDAAVRQELMLKRASMLPDVGLAAEKLRVILGTFNANYLIGECSERAMQEAQAEVGITYGRGWQRRR